MALRTNLFRRHAELIAEGAGECFMGIVTGPERNAENIGSTFAEKPGGRAEAAAPDVAADRTASHGRKGT